LTHVVDEHGDCADCWRDTALAAVDAAAGLLIGSAGTLPELDAGLMGEHLQQPPRLVTRSHADRALTWQR
jgi:hypothetical protein